MQYYVFDGWFLCKQFPCVVCRLQERIKLKKLENEEKERKEGVKQERLRRTSGKDITDIKHQCCYFYYSHFSVFYIEYIYICISIG